MGVLRSTLFYQSNLDSVQGQQFTAKMPNNQETSIPSFFPTIEQNSMVPIPGFTFLHHKFSISTQKDSDSVDDCSGEVLLTDYQTYIRTKCSKLHSQPKPFKSYENFSNLMRNIKESNYICEGFNYAGDNKTKDIVGHIQKSQTKDLSKSSKTVFGVDIWNLTDNHMIGTDLYVHSGYPHPLVVWQARKSGENSFQAVPVGNLANFVIMPFSVERLFFRKADYSTSGTSGVMRFRLMKGLTDDFSVYHNAAPFIMWDLPHSGRFLHGSRNEFAVGFDYIHGSDNEQFCRIQSCKSPEGEYFSKKVGSKAGEDVSRICWPTQQHTAIPGNYQIEMLTGAGELVASIVTIKHM